MYIYSYTQNSDDDDDDGLNPHSQYSNAIIPKRISTSTDISNFEQRRAAIHNHNLQQQAKTATIKHADTLVYCIKSLYYRLGADNNGMSRILALALNKREFKLNEFKTYDQLNLKMPQLSTLFMNAYFGQAIADEPTHITKDKIRKIQQKCTNILQPHLLSVTPRAINAELASIFNNPHYDTMNMADTFRSRFDAIKNDLNHRISSRWIGFIPDNCMVHFVPKSCTSNCSNHHYCAKCGDLSHTITDCPSAPLWLRKEIRGWREYRQRKSKKGKPGRHGRGKGGRGRGGRGYSQHVGLNPLPHYNPINNNINNPIATNNNVPQS